MSILLTKTEREENKNRGFNPDKYKFFDMIEIEDINKFTMDSINVYGTEEKLAEANKVSEVLVQMLRKRNLISENVQQSYIDILLSATLLHNLFYDEEDFTTLFKARRVLSSIADGCEIPQQVQDALFQTIEAQLGEDTPIPTSKPIANSPTELFAWAVWFIKEYKPQE